jgi:hypothetical protein
MNSEQKELFRLAMLRVFDANRTRYGLGIVAIAHHLTPFGFGAKDFKGADEFYAAIEDELQYLCDKNFAEEALKNISAENRAWRITRDGIAFVDRHN